MDDDSISYFSFESEQVRQEGREKRKDIIILVLILIIFLNNIAWLWFFNQFDIMGDAVTLESSEEGNASYMGAGASGVIDNGRGESQDN